MMRARSTRADAVMAVVLLGLGASGVTAQQSYTLEGDPAIYALAGEVEIVAGSGSEVQVTVERLGADASRLEVESGVVGGRSSLRVIFPGDEVVYDRGDGSRYQTQLQVRDDGTFGEGQGRRVRIRGAGAGLRAHVRLRVAVPTDRSLLVRIGAGEIRASNLRGDLELDASAGPITASGITGRLSADTGSGSIRLTDIDGDIEADTGSGSIEVTGVNAERLHMDTGSGQIRVEGGTAREVYADTGSGSIALLRLSAEDVQVDTGSGAVEVGLTSAVRRMLIDTGSGGVRVGLAPPVDALIEVDTGSGSIEVDFPVDIISMERDSFRGRAGAGTGEIRIDTGSGDIRLTGGN